LFLAINWLICPVAQIAAQKTTVIANCVGPSLRSEFVTLLNSQKIDAENN